MKKLLSVAAVLIFMLSMAGCFGENTVTTIDPTGSTAKDVAESTESVTEQESMETSETKSSEATTVETTEPVTEEVTEETTQETTEEVTEEPTEETSEEATEDEGQDYILNTNTKKFHYPNCGSAAKIKESNRKEYHGTREELIAMGYDPCGNCHP